MSVAARALHGVNVCIIPNPDNDHRPLLLRPGALKVISALLIAAKVAAVTMVALTPSYAELSTITVDRIVQLTNAERVKAGLQPLAVNSKLAAAARDKAAHMLAEDYFAHISPAGVTPWFWMSKHGYTYKVAGENLAIDFVEAENVVAAWIASPTHKENMLHDSYTETGVAVATGEFQGATSTVVVHMFGLPPGGAPASKASPPVASQAPPAATPAPVAPSATPTPLPVEPPTPRTPRIALAEPGSTVGQVAAVTVTGEPGSTVEVVVNEDPVANLTLPGSGTAVAELDLSGQPDGPLRVTAVSRIAGAESEAALLLVTKDGTGPAVAEDAIQFLLNPLFDRSEAFAWLPETETGASWRVNGGAITGRGVMVSAQEAVDIRAVDAAGNETVLDETTLKPQFAAEEAGESQMPIRIVRYSNRFIATVLAVLAGLFVLTVVVHLQIQRPRLLGHAMTVILLAGALLWW